MLTIDNVFYDSVSILWDVNNVVDVWSGVGFEIFEMGQYFFKEIL